jgi:ATP synthase protein I
MGSGTKTAAMVVGGQIGVTLAIAGIAGWFGGAKPAWSAATGGLISIVTTAFFALRVFMGGSDAPLNVIVRSFYAGEVQKLILTAVLFYAAIRWMDLSFLPLFVTYAVTLLMYWVVLPFSLESR